MFRFLRDNVVFGSFVKINNIHLWSEQKMFVHYDVDHNVLSYTSNGTIADHNAQIIKVYAIIFIIIFKS